MRCSITSVASVPGLDPRVISFVRGQAMYLQEFGTGAEKFNLLAHEMTHLVFNRFLPDFIEVFRCDFLLVVIFCSYHVDK